MPYQFSWSTELYGHGYWLRKWLGWPQWLPFPASSDHGVSQDSYHAQHEVENEFLIHFYWSDQKKKYSFQSKPHTFKRFIQVPHPYLILKNQLFQHSCNEKKGIVVFWPHTTPLYSYSDAYVPLYLNYLDNFQERFERINVCVASNDLTASWISLIKSRFNVISAGDSSSADFATNLFYIIDQHEYATSPLGGSELFYCTIMGTKYFIEGPVPNLINLGDPNIPQGSGLNRSMAFNATIEQKIQLFAPANRELWSDKVSFVESLLGVSSNPSRFLICLLLLVELVRLSLTTHHGFQIIVHYTKNLYIALKLKV